MVLADSSIEPLRVYSGFNLTCIDFDATQNNFLE